MDIAQVTLRIRNPRRNLGRLLSISQPPPHCCTQEINGVEYPFRPKPPQCKFMSGGIIRDHRCPELLCNPKSFSLTNISS